MIELIVIIHLLDGVNRVTEQTYLSCMSSLLPKDAFSVLIDVILLFFLVSEKGYNL